MAFDAGLEAVTYSGAELSAKALDSLQSFYWDEYLGWKILLQGDEVWLVTGYRGKDGVDQFMKIRL